jgi:hypothetical protein
MHIPLAIEVSNRYTVPQSSLDLRSGLAFDPTCLAERAVDKESRRLSSER